MLDTQPVVDLLTCPCWNSYSQETLAAALNAESVDSPTCSINNPGGTRARDLADGLPSILAENGTSTDCRLGLSSADTGLVVVSQLEADACNAELASVIPLINWCPAPPK